MCTQACLAEGTLYVVRADTSALAGLAEPPLVLVFADLGAMAVDADALAGAMDAEGTFSVLAAQPALSSYAAMVAPHLLHSALLAAAPVLVEALGRQQVVAEAALFEVVR